MQGLCFLITPKLFTKQKKTVCLEVEVRGCNGHPMVRSMSKGESRSIMSWVSSMSLLESQSKEI